MLWKGFYHDFSTAIPPHSHQEVRPSDSYSTPLESQVHISHVTIYPGAAPAPVT